MLDYWKTSLQQEEKLWVRRYKYEKKESAVIQPITPNRIIESPGNSDEGRVR